MADILESREQPWVCNTIPVVAVATVALVAAAAVVTVIMAIRFIGHMPRARHYPMCFSHVLSLILPVTLHHRWYHLQLEDEETEA